MGQSPPKRSLAVSPWHAERLNFLDVEVGENFLEVGSVIIETDVPFELVRCPCGWIMTKRENRVGVEVLIFLWIKLADTLRASSL